MPKKHTGSSKNKFRHEEKVDIYKGDAEEYGKIEKVLGDCKVTVVLPDKSVVMGCIPGKYRRRVYFGVDDVVLLGIREFEQKRADVLYKYSPQEIEELRKNHELPDFFFEHEIGNQTRNDTFHFDYDPTPSLDANELAAI